MNQSTKEDLIKFANAVEDLAIAVSSFVGTEAYEGVIRAAENLKQSVRRDETLHPSVLGSKGDE
jgi:hypothetical protein